MWLPGSHHTRTGPPGSASRRRRGAAESAARMKMPAGGATGSEDPPGSLDRGNSPEPAHLRRRRASVAPAAAVPDEVAPATRREPAARRPTGTVAPGQWRRQGGCQPGRVRAGLSPIPPGGRALAARLTQRRSGTAGVSRCGEDAVCGAGSTLASAAPPAGHSASDRALCAGSQRLCTGQTRYQGYRWLLQQPQELERIVMAEVTSVSSFDGDWQFEDSLRW